MPVTAARPVHPATIAQILFALKRNFVPVFLHEPIFDVAAGHAAAYKAAHVCTSTVSSVLDFELDRCGTEILEFRGCCASDRAIATMPLTCGITPFTEVTRQGSQKWRR